MSTPIEQNTTELQTILEMVNNLPAAGSGGGYNPLIAFARGEKWDITAEDLAGVTRIADFAFVGWSAIQELYLPDSVLSIGLYAFSNCLIKRIDLGNGVEDISNSAFKNAFHSEYEEEFLELEIPNNVKTIGGEAFADLPYNTTVIFKGIPNYISQSAFNNGEELTIKVPWSEGEVPYAPWVDEESEATPNIIYNYTED